jgi:zinc-finger of transposase IS204/IS1001/IS1096/IS1165
MDNNLQIPPDLPDVRVLNVSKIERGAWLILVESTIIWTSCRKCGKPITDYHGLDTSIRLRHLPVFEIPVYIELRPKRYRCPHCEGKPTSTQGHFEKSRGVKLFHYHGVVEILTPVIDHELFKTVIGILIETFLLDREIEFTPTGSMTQQIKGIDFSIRSTCILLGKTSRAAAVKLLRAKHPIT